MGCRKWTLEKAAINISDGNGNWIAKQANSTFFPSSWTIDVVMQEVAFVRSKISNKLSERKWVGLASDGTKIEVRYTGILGNLTFDTVFPLP